jgi:hypothetical protein
MQMKASSLHASLAALVLLVAGCSSGGGKHATWDLGSCPSLPPTTSLAKLNAGVQGLAKRLVPIAAVRVRWCEYGLSTGRVDTFMLPQPAVTLFEGDTNRLPAGSLAASCMADVPFDFLTFASGSQKVVVAESCGDVTNGVFSALPTAQWSNELQQYTTGSTATSHTTGAIDGTLRLVAGVAMNRQISGTVTATSTLGIRTRATTTSTRPFSMTLSAGTYRLTGTSPAARVNNGAQQQCLALAPVVVMGGKTTHVEVVCDLG